MKKTLLAFLVISLLVLPFMSSGTLAGACLLDYDTGIKANGPSDTVTLSWEIKVSPGFEQGAVVTIRYKHTTPPSARPGGFDLSELEIDMTVIDEIWYGSATFVSFINENADRGTNHGRIRISWEGHPDFGWSFNVQHS